MKMSALAAAGALAPSVAARPARGETGLKTVLRGGRCFLWNHWRTHDVGIDMVFVNGKLAYRDGALKETGGVAIRYS
ncbi:MAG: hypothetical protein LBT74_09340 [Acidobacteriota bacterium]|nr:hypothetical protein [Acidobacteriota bacterium]